MTEESNTEHLNIYFMKTDSGDTIEILLDSNGDIRMHVIEAKYPQPQTIRFTHKEAKRIDENLFRLLGENQKRTDQEMALRRDIR